MCFLVTKLHFPTQDSRVPGSLPLTSDGELLKESEMKGWESHTERKEIPPPHRPRVRKTESPATLELFVVAVYKAKQL